MSDVDRAVRAEVLAERLPDPADLPARAAWALADGWRFAGLHGAGGADDPRVRVAFAREERTLLLDCPAPDRRVPSLVEAIPAAQWDEREAHDLHGIGFEGHDPLRPLVMHADRLEAWTTPVRGRDVHQVAVGPIHAGVIESGHFRFHVVGERILHVDLRLFHKHRGLERAAEGADAERALALAARACGACAVANAVACATAWESASGLWPSDGLQRVRTLLLELERLYNHLHDIAAICAGVGFAAGTAAFAALKERAQRVNERLTGHRFLFGAVRVGASDLVIDRLAAREAAEEIAAIAAELAVAWRQLQFAHSAQERFAGVGVLPRATALELGAVGPAARASGVDDDVRRHSPRLAYAGFVPARPERPDGDVAARLELRRTELTATTALIARLLGQPHAPSAAHRSGCAGTLGAGRVESPRGATLCTVELDGERVARLHLRTGSYANWPALASAVAGELLPDFPLVNKSFELCYACVDR